MYEDANGVMISDSTVLREIQHTFHYGLSETVADLFGEDWDGETGPINEAPCLEPIDNDPTINTILADQNL